METNYLIQYDIIYILTYISTSNFVNTNTKAQNKKSGSISLGVVVPLNLVFYIYDTIIYCGLWQMSVEVELSKDETIYRYCIFSIYRVFLGVNDKNQGIVT